MTTPDFWIAFWLQRHQWKHRRGHQASLPLKREKTPRCWHHAHFDFGFLVHTASCLPRAGMEGFWFQQLRDVLQTSARACFRRLPWWYRLWLGGILWCWLSEGHLRLCMGWQDLRHSFASWACERCLLGSFSRSPRFSLPHPPAPEFKKNSMNNTMSYKIL